MVCSLVTTDVIMTSRKCTKNNARALRAGDIRAIRVFFCALPVEHKECLMPSNSLLLPLCYLFLITLIISWQHHISSKHQLPNCQAAAFCMAR